MPTNEQRLRYLSINGEYLTNEFLDGVWEHLHRMAAVWQSGIDKPSPADQLAYLVMKQVTMGTMGMPST